MILCYRCGTAIEPNNTNMCNRCLNNTMDLSSRVKKTMVVETCRGCERYHTPPSKWKGYAWGSQDLLIFLLSRNKTLKKLNIIDSSFLYTEEHSSRARIEIIILENAVEQPVLLEYSFRNKQCPSCTRVEAQQFWRAAVQLRQHPHHRRTFLYIEHLMLQHKVHLSTSNIVNRKDGIDFLFADNTAALKLVDFLRKFFGVQIHSSAQLISTDPKNNTANKKFTYAIELMPFCTDDLVYVTDPAVGLGRLLLVKKARSCVEFLDPFTNKIARIGARQYFSHKGEYKTLLRSKDFTEFRVVHSRRAKDGLFEGVVCDGTDTRDVVTSLPLEDDGIVYGYDLETFHASLDLDIPSTVLLVRKDIAEFEEFADDDLEKRYLLSDVSSDRNMLLSIIGSSPKHPVIDELSKMGFNAK